MLSPFLQELQKAVGLSGLIVQQDELRTYECDGLTNFRQLPLAVVLPSTAGEVQAVLSACWKYKVPFVARGSGTGLSGGALPVEGGIVLSLARLNRILEVDIPNHRVVVEPGVINAVVTQEVAPFGFLYAPDPSSQSVCSIGGNTGTVTGGTNSGTGTGASNTGGVTNNNGHGSGTVTSGGNSGAGDDSAGTVGGIAAVGADRGVADWAGDGDAEQSGDGDGEQDLCGPGRPGEAGAEAAGN